jgi:UDP-N-acetylmuramate dehydrogenase
MEAPEPGSGPFRGRLQHDAEVAACTTYGIGGKVRLLFQPADVDDLIHFIRWAEAEGQRYMVLGNGSNLLFPDAPLDLALIRMVGGLDRIAELGPGRFEVEAGVRNEDLVEALADRGWRGAEFLHDIPGSLGGAVVMNAGNDHGETAAILESVTWIEHGGGLALQTSPAAELSFGYRSGPFHPGSGRTVVRAVLCLPERGEPYMIHERVAAIRAERQRKFPLEPCNCGSVFKRPPGDYAGRLIEAAGCKEMRQGDAMVSPRHAGFIVNQGAATAEDVKTLVARVTERVFERSGVRLERELIYVE